MFSENRLKFDNNLYYISLTLLIYEDVYINLYKQFLFLILLILTTIIYYSLKQKFVYI